MKLPQPASIAQERIEGTTCNKHSLRIHVDFLTLKASGRLGVVAARERLPRTVHRAQANA